MVKTRHGGGKEKEDEEFLTLRGKNSKRNSRSDIFEDIISTVSESNFYTPGKKGVYSMDSSSGTSKDSPIFSSSRRGKRGRQSSRLNTDGSTPIRSLQKSSPRLTRTRSRGPNGLLTDSNLRRSQRERTSTYSTMDQNLLADLQLQGASDLISGERVTRRSSVRMTRAKIALKDELNEPEGPAENEAEESDESDKDFVVEEENEEEDNKLNMYSRVKLRHIAARKARQEREEQRRQEEEERKKMEAEKEKEAEEESEESEEETDEDSSDEEDSDEEEEEEDEKTRRSYHLREHRVQPKRFEVPVNDRKRRRRKTDILEELGISASPVHRRYRKMHLTPVRSPRFKRRKHHATHNSSSTSSEESDDERKFERRKSKSMAKARRRCLPMNFGSEEASSIVIKDRQRIGASLADVDPMNIDSSVTFESVGGLGKHLQALKEMVVFPLLYPEVFERFKITPPRGVLFHGPPGTGKTLVARALANECRNGDKRVAFFMRKGADCLSKWVGESERQLRLLFDQAYSMRPSIIFFDEIDGLAPVRSSRQDQIHSSIVSTLLALMDGLDSRGEIVVIGATNRIDSIDPALRRPGRFDREFLFTLPSQEARHSIMSIHTKDWNPKLSDAFLSELAEKCVGYCGADIKALCTEAALFALRHQYPQIYASKEKLQLDPTQIQVTARDFHNAMQRIVPAAQRAVVSPGRGLSWVVGPLLKRQMVFILEGLKRMFLTGGVKTSSRADNVATSDSTDVLNELLYGDGFDDESGPCIYEKLNARKKKSRSSDEDVSQVKFMDFESSSFSGPTTYRPRLLILGHQDQGHSTHLAPAIIHHYESLPVHCLDLPTLYAVSAKTPEESCAQVFREARRTAPSIIYMPHISQWWQACTYTLQATFLTLLQDLPPHTPILLLATADCLIKDIPDEVRELFPAQREVYTMRNPTSDERREFFTEIVLNTAAKPPPRRKETAAKVLEVLPVAAPPEPRQLTKTEQETLNVREEATLRELRIFLRGILERIIRDKKYRPFLNPVDPLEVEDYYQVIKNPMDLLTMLNKVNLHKYHSAKEFLEDIDLICSNALEYNPDTNPSDRLIRSRACEMKDTAYAIIDAEMDSDFEQLCIDITESRSKRGETPTKNAPTFYRTLPQLEQEQAQIAARQSLMPFRRTSYSGTEQLGGQGMGMTPNTVPRKKKRRLRSSWARGYIKKPKKKPARIIEDDENEDDEANPESDIKLGEGQEMTSQESGQDMVTQDSAGDDHQVGICNGVINGESSNDTCNELTDTQGNENDGGGTHPNGQTDNGVSEDNDACSIHSEPSSTKLSRLHEERSLRLAENTSVGVEETDIQDKEQLLNGFCDHEDSTENKAASQESNVAAMGTNPSEPQGEDMQVEDVTAEESPRTRRLTRRMTADMHAQRALEILAEPIPPLVVDHDRLKVLLDTIVIQTTNWTVANLEKLHCSLNQCIFRHRLDYDKTKLTEEMEREVTQAKSCIVNT